MSKRASTIIWAIDPFKTDKQTLTKSALYLDQLARDFRVKVRPTYILSPHTFYLPIDYFVPPTAVDFVRQARTKLEELLKSVKSPNFLPGNVLYDDSTTLKGTVDTFVENAKDENALLIFATTHGRKGLRRFWLGSFVETLLMYSAIPTISINPSSKVLAKPNSILLPTDLVKNSKKVLSKILPLAKRLNAKISILHVLRSPVMELGMEAVGPMNYSYYEKAWDDIKKSAQKKLDNWVEQTKKAGVRCEGTLIESADSISDVIISMSKAKKANLVAMASVSGPVENILTGGITRQIVRYNDCPTWIVH